MKRNIFKFIILGLVVFGLINNLEASDRRGKRTQATQSGGISVQEAKEIAAKKAGVSVNQVAKIKLDYENGVKIYEGKIYNNGYEYEFDIDVKTGQIIKWKVEIDD